MAIGAVRRASTIARAMRGAYGSSPNCRKSAVSSLGVECREQLRRRDAAARVESHVERAAGAEPEAALRVRELVAGQAEVEQEPVDGRETRRRRDGPQLAEVRLAKNQPIAESGEALSDSGDGRPVGIETEEAAIRIGRLQNPLGVPTAADRGIDLKASGRRREHRHDLLRQHRQVPFLHLSSTIDNRIPSGSWKRMWYA